MWIQKILVFGRLIKFSHTIFALPFALAAVILAHREIPFSLFTLFWILAAMASARSAAMGFNRLVDYEYDRRNPRTADRPLTAGHIDRASVALFIGGSSVLFMISAAFLGRLCFMLSIPVLGVLFSYSYTKRFTSFSHLVLGFAIGLAPIGAWIASTGRWDWRILPLSLGLMTYIAGFDILYACQDIDFDRANRLHSLPACHGAERAFRMAAVLHALTFVFLMSVFFTFDLGRVYLAFLAVISMLLMIEHRLVRPGRMERIDLAFFHVNSAISILLFLGVLADTVLA